MRVIDPGHLYSLANLKTGGETVLQFFQDSELHGGDGRPGTSSQEVIRALIDRVQTLDAECPWEGNATIIRDLRHALAGFEARALLRHVEKHDFAIEVVPVGADGHLIFGTAE